MKFAKKLRAFFGRFKGFYALKKKSFSFTLSSSFLAHSSSNVLRICE